jgi:hypothetical protein
MWRQDSTQQQAPPAPPGVPLTPEYDAEVNKGDISVKWLPRKLNERARQGWRLHTVLEQHGNTVMIWERWRSG